MVWYGGLRRLSDAPEDQTVSFPHPVDVLGCVKNSYFLGLLRKIRLYKPPCKKIFFLRFLNFDEIIFLKMTLGQIFWLNSSSVMVLEYINKRKNWNGV